MRLYSLSLCLSMVHVAAFRPIYHAHASTRCSPLFVSKKNLSASEFARREESKSRRQRAGDVVIGKTSAMQDAKDYALNPKATEEEWLRQASLVEKQVYKATETGLESLKMLKIEEASEAFDRVFELKPDAYLWQAGIAKFYLGDMEAAADIFAKSAATYETKFSMPATEERIWRHACELKLLSSMSKKERKSIEEFGGGESLLTVVPENDGTAKLLRSETRKVLRVSRELFAASISKNYSEIILSRARLRSIGGAFDTRPNIDRKMWRLNSWYYLGLHYDCLGNFEESKRCMKMALLMCPSGSGEDIVHTLPLLHMKQRDWFDDDEWEGADVDPSDESVQTKATEKEPVDADPILIESIKSSLTELRLVDLRDALRIRGIKAQGSKSDLQKRLYQSLMEDAGLAW
jgi:tetratricopeptide (TPR) repeat protein